MNVLLINPPRTHAVGLETPPFVRAHEGVFPPLGLMYIASYLKSRLNIRAAMLDMAAEGMESSGIAGYLNGIRLDIAGITSHTQNLRDIVSLVRHIKNARADVHVCLGGPHATMFPRETIGLPFVDSAVVGEGEETFAELAQCLRENGDLSNVKGIVFRRNGQIVETGVREPLLELDALPFPERSLLPLQRYRSILGRSSAMATIISSRGCPFRCSFCSTPRGAFRARSPENIVDEIGECLSRGIDEIHFVDDTFNADPKRVEHICAELERRRMRVRWSFRGRVDVITRPMLQKARAAGCYRIHLGVETASDAGLALLKKDITVKQVQTVFQWARAAGISTVAYFLIGCPHEQSSADVKETIAFACRLDPDFALFNILTPYPGTELFDYGVSRGVLSPGCWRNFAAAPEADFKPVFWEEHLDRSALVSLLSLAYKRFYLRPSCVIRAVFASSDMRGLAEKIRAGAALCRMRPGDMMPEEA